VREAAASIHAAQIEREEVRLDGLGPPGASDGWFDRRWAVGLLEEALRRCAALLREVVAETLEPGADVEDELAQIRRALP
jgi:hypothetical protein